MDNPAPASAAPVIPGKSPAQASTPATVYPPTRMQAAEAAWEELSGAEKQGGEDERPEPSREEQPATEPQPEDAPSPESERPEDEETPDVATPTPQRPERGRPQKGDKAPAGWTPAARASWITLPQAVREEVSRRERQTEEVLRGSAEARQLSSAVTEMVTPYLGQMGNQHPLAYTHQLLKDSATLRSGRPAEKAQLLASYIRDNGVDVDALVDALEGKAPSPSRQPQAAPRDPELEALLQREKQRESRVAQAAVQRAHQELTQAVESGKMPYLEDVREAMADFIDLKTKQGVAWTLEQAYAWGCSQNPEVQKVMAQHASPPQQGVRPKTRTESLSVRSSPAGASTPPQPKTRMQHLEAEWNAQAARKP